MWDKGQMTLEQLQTNVVLSYCHTLIPLCRGARKRWLEAIVEKLITKPRPVATAM
jgi:hypothetical protein